LSVAVAAGRIEIRLTDTSGGSVLTAQNIFGPGTLFFPLSDYAGVNLTQIQSVLVSLVTDTQGDYHLRDIRTQKIASKQAAADLIIQSLYGGDDSRALLWTHEEPVDENSIAQGRSIVSSWSTRRQTPTGRIRSSGSSSTAMPPRPRSMSAIGCRP
jgi:hypothetical protein